MDYPFWSVGITNPLLVFNFIDMARERASVEIYSPRYTKRQYIRRASKWKDVSRPAYGGYFFVRVVDSNTVFSLLRITIACSVLRTGGQFVSVRDSEIVRLQEMESRNEFTPTDDGEYKLKFEHGKIVAIKHGAAAGKKASLISKINDKLVWAEVEGKKIKIPIYFFAELEDGFAG